MLVAQTCPTLRSHGTQGRSEPSTLQADSLPEPPDNKGSSKYLPKFVFLVSTLIFFSYIYDSVSLPSPVEILFILSQLTAMDFMDSSILS